MCRYRCRGLSVTLTVQSLPALQGEQEDTWSSGLPGAVLTCCCRAVTSSRQEGNRLHLPVKAGLLHSCSMWEWGGNGSPLFMQPPRPPECTATMSTSGWSLSNPHFHCDVNGWNSGLGVEPASFTWEIRLSLPLLAASSGFGSWMFETGWQGIKIYFSWWKLRGAVFLWHLQGLI